MATFGDIRFSMSKMHPGADHDLLDGWILDGYQHILGELDWQRQEVKVSIAVPAEYVAGTVAVTKGSTTVTGTGTTWTTEMTGRLFRVPDGLGEYYQFTYNTATTATLDRPYESATAAAVSYRIAQNVFRLPTDARSIQGIDGLAFKLAREYPEKRQDHGAPCWWSWAMDSATDPPCLQVEVYPVPVEARLLAVMFTSEAAQGSTVDTEISLLPWVRPAAIKSYVSAQVALALEKNGALHDRHMAAFGVHLAQMRKTEAEQRQVLELRPPVAPHRVSGRDWRGRRR